MGLCGHACSVQAALWTFFPCLMAPSCSLMTVRASSIALHTNLNLFQLRAGEGLAANVLVYQVQLAVGHGSVPFDRLQCSGCAAGTVEISVWGGRRHGFWTLSQCADVAFEGKTMMLLMPGFPGYSDDCRKSIIIMAVVNRAIARSWPSTSTQVSSLLQWLAKRDLISFCSFDRIVRNTTMRC